MSRAIGQPPAERKKWLTEYLLRSVGRGAWSSYGVFRKNVPTIYGVERPLDLSPKVGRAEIKANIIKACKGKDVNMNVEAAMSLYDLVRPEDYKAYDHDTKNLRLGVGREAAIQVKQFLVKDDVGIFQYAYPRATVLNDDLANLMMSLIYHSYATGDYKGSIIEIAELSKPGKEREPYIRRLNMDDLISMDGMQKDIQSVHDLLLEIGDEHDRDLGV